MLNRFWDERLACRAWLHLLKCSSQAWWTCQVDEWQIYWCHYDHSHVSCPWLLGNKSLGTWMGVINLWLEWLCITPCSMPKHAPSPEIINDTQVLAIYLYAFSQSFQFIQTSKSSWSSFDSLYPPCTNLETCNEQADFISWITTCLSNINYLVANRWKPKADALMPFLPHPSQDCFFCVNCKYLGKCSPCGD